jgi:iron complex transport system ATP-binding protein
MTRTGRSDDVAGGDAEVSGFVSKIVLLTRFVGASTNPRVHYCAVSHAENARTGPATPGHAPDGANLELDGVSVRYPGAPTPALSDVTLRIRGGEVTALLGANGAGKSTLLRVAAGLLAPTTGSVRVTGRDARRDSRQLLARRVAFVPQSEAIPVAFRVRDVVAMGRAPHQGTWMRESAADREAIDEAMARCDITALAERRIETLSGGEQRRVSIARALAQRPRVLLLDEPAAFLDMRHRLSFYGLLAEAAERERIACGVAMHDLDAAARFATSAVLLRGGRVVAAGAPADVMTADRLGAALEAEVVVGVHAPSGQRYFLPIRTTPVSIERPPKEPFDLRVVGDADANGDDLPTA